MAAAEKTLVVLQSNYIPWKGYFDLINRADEFIIYDDCQYTKNDWRNRNQIKTQQGLQWLSIPVRKVALEQKINETETSDQRWRKKHWSTLCQSYGKAPFFSQYRDIFEALYLSGTSTSLSEINLGFIKAINHILGIDTLISSSTDYQLTGDSTERLLGLCEQAGASDYLSGPAAQAYFDVHRAKERNISVHWMNYSDYPVYPQLHEPFEHFVSILDLLFNTGPAASSYMKSFGQ